MNFACNTASSVLILKRKWRRQKCLCFHSRIVTLHACALRYSALSLCTGFIFNRAAMGRARFLFYTGFIINRAAMGRARFLLCTGFIIIFRRFFLSVTRPKPQLGQFAIGTLNHATWDVYSPKAVETLMYGYSFLYCI